MEIEKFLDQRCDRIAELMAVNGGRLKVEGNIGSTVHDPSVNRYGRLGLDLNEAFELTFYHGVIEGACLCSQNPKITYKQIMERLTRQSRGQVIEIATPEQQKELLKV